jgi:hypothetical protein
VPPAQSQKPPPAQSQKPPLAQSPQPQNPCPGVGNAPSPQQFAANGQAANQRQQFYNSMNDPSGGGAASAGLLFDFLDLLKFRRGGSYDAQAYGSTPAYGNYAYGVYMSADGYSFSTTLSGANLFGATSTYTPSYVASHGGYDPLYPNLPLSNIENIISGFLQQQNGSLCTKKP